MLTHGWGYIDGDGRTAPSVALFREDEFEQNHGPGFRDGFEVYSLVIDANGASQPRLALYAKLELSPERPVGIHTNRRSPWKLPRTEVGAFFDARLILETGDELQPGSTQKVRIDPLSPDSWSHVKEGDSIVLCEGWQAIGVAVIERVVGL